MKFSVGLEIKVVAWKEVEIITAYLSVSFEEKTFDALFRNSYNFKTSEAAAKHKMFYGIPRDNKCSGASH